VEDMDEGGAWESLLPRLVMAVVRRLFERRCSALDTHLVVASGGEELASWGREVRLCSVVSQHRGVSIRWSCSAALSSSGVERGVPRGASVPTPGPVAVIPDLVVLRLFSLGRVLTCGVSAACDVRW
jgi:hypothetical protein